MGQLLPFKIIRPTHRGLRERLGKYNRFLEPGLNFVIPFLDGVVTVNITEMMVDAEAQEVITKDNLNAQVDAQVYFRVKKDEENVKASVYNVFNCKAQIVQLARTTLRNIIGTMTLTEVNSSRDNINQSLYQALSKETTEWGIEIVRTELKEVSPPRDVQETMNKIVKAANEKAAAVDFATAAETEADGKKRSAIKNAEGRKQAAILDAEGTAQSIRLKAEADANAIQVVNTAAREYFKDQAVTLKTLEVTQASLQNATKIVIPEGSKMVNILGDLAGVVTPQGE